MPEFLSRPVPNEAAARFIADKPAVSREVFEQLLPDLQARAFTIAGVENANVMQSVRDLIAEVPKGGDWHKAKGEIADRISPYLGDGAERRAELLLRQHGYQAYQAAQHEVLDRQRAAFPFWQYQSAEDDRVRESHAALNGLVMPADSPFWQNHYPPWDWGCRCYVVPLTEDDVADMEREDAAKKPEERRVLDTAQREQLEKSGIVQRAPDGGVPRPINVTPGPEAPRFDPSSLRLGADQLKPRYDTDTWAHFEAWARGQKIELRGGAERTVWDWMNSPAPRAPRARAPRVQRVAPAAPAAPAVPAAPAIPAPATTEDFKLAANTIEYERTAIRAAVYQSEKRIGQGVNGAVLLTNGRKVVFKARDAEYGTTLRKGIAQGTQYLREVAASVLDEELGLGLVPPTTLLTRAGRQGSAQLFRDGFRTAGAYPEAPRLIARLPDRVKHDWQLFEDLVNNLDRHAGNFMLRVTGAKGAETVELALIDNGLTLSTVSQPKRYSGPMEGKAIDATNLTRLQQLLDREAEISSRLGNYLEPRAVQLFFQRARTLLTRKTYGDS